MGREVLPVTDAESYLRSTRRFSTPFAGSALASLALACGSGVTERQPPSAHSAGAPSTSSEPPADVICAEPLEPKAGPSLQQAFEGAFTMGVALDPTTFANPESESAELVKTHFAQISPENVLKWSEIHPTKTQYRFNDADRFVEFGEQNGMAVYGHVLVWHQQTPDWVFQDDAGQPISAEGLWARLEEHVATLAERYGARIGTWDVVNEALMDDGSLRESPWRTILGDDYVAEVFELVSRLMPDSRLIYNDYSMFLPAKRDAAAAMILDMRARDIRVDAVGMQGHYNLRRPTLDEVDAALATFAEAGIEVLVTELDLDVLPSQRDVQGADLDAVEANALDPYRYCLPADVDATVAEHWGRLFEVFVRHRESLATVTFWGVSDERSWLNDWPVRGRTNYPLLFNDQLQPKTNFAKVLEQAPPRD